MKQKKSILIGLAIFLVAALFIASAKFVGEALRTPKPPSPQGVPLARIQTINGQVKVRRNLSSEWKTASVGQSLYHLDRLETGRNSNALLEFNSQTSLEVLDDSIVSIEAWNELEATSPVYFNVHRGDFLLKQPGQEGQLYVVMNGRLFAPQHRAADVAPLIEIRGSSTNAAAIVPSEESKEALDLKDTARTTSVTENREEITANQGSAGTLSNQYIDQVLAGQRSLFQKCQSIALREEGQARGQLLVGIVIEPSGSVSSAKVLQNTSISPKLESCVLDIFNRLQFSAFKGPAIARSYPLQFE